MLALFASAISCRASAASPQNFLVILAANPSPSGDLVTAERRVHDLLFQSGAVVSGRAWYRFGADTMTLVESGPGPRSTEALSAAKGNWAAVESDYARFLTRPHIKLRESRFIELFRPQPRPHQLDMGRVLEASAGDWTTGGPVQLVVLRERSGGTAEPGIPAEVVTRFDRAGEGFHVASKAEEPMGSSYVVETSEILPGEASSGQVAHVGKHGWFLGMLARLFRFVLDLAAIVAIAAITRWAWIQRFRTRHFGLWIPGFAGAFSLPRPTEDGQANFRARLPRYAGEPAVHLELPSRTIRVLFYFGAKLQWDPRLRVDALEPAATECSLFRLPRFVRFVWVERPAEEGNLSLSIVRPRMLGGNERIDIAVNFLALKPTSPE